jgi:hypothetical protein
MQKPIPAVLLGLVALTAVSAAARSEQQLPINELNACEIVLHELIADLARVQTNARHEVIDSHDDLGLYNARHQAKQEALAQAISLAQAKYSRCP